ncbi:MAG: zinc ribbon domain-containing protein [Chloroflexota bacterium]|nr:zinc ribbon domain-containing protein [Chloroflexota bacterium]
MAFCTACGAEVPEGARFCQNCGAEMTSAVGIVPTQTDPAPIQLPHSPAVMLPYGYAPPNYLPPFPVAPGYVVAPTRSGKAVAAFWLGIVSIPCCILSWIGIIIGVLGLIFGLLGLGEARRTAAATGESPARYGYRQAAVGIACAVVGIIASAAFLVYLLNNLDKYGIKLTR